MQMCLSAAMTLAALPVMAKGTLGCLLPRQAVQWVARLAPRLACCAIVALSLSRVAALLLNYGAPMQVYRQLPQVCKFHINAHTSLYLLSVCMLSPASHKCPAMILRMTGQSSAAPELLQCELRSAFVSKSRWMRVLCDHPHVRPGSDAAARNQPQLCLCGR